MTFSGNPNSGGTGFVIETPNKGKVVITNAHVCKGGEKEGRVVLSGKALAHPVEMPILESRPEEDLCVVEAPHFLKPLKLGKAPVDGQHVSVLGFPFLRPLTLTEGYIRDLAYEVEFFTLLDETDCNKSNEKKKTIDTWFGKLEVCSASYISYEMTVTIYPGNSGSPLLDDNGLVIGVAFATAPGMGASNALRFTALQTILSVY